MPAMIRLIGVTMNQWTDAPVFPVFWFPVTGFMRKRLTILPYTYYVCLPDKLNHANHPKYKEHDEVCQVLLVKNTVIECKLIRYSRADMTENRVVSS